MSTTTNPSVLVERDGAVLIITLNRPEAMNALDGPTTGGLLAAINELETDPTLAVGLLTGSGKGFCSGMDLKAFAKEGAPKGLAGLLRRGSAKPLVGAIEGFAFAGGLELALLCDLLAVARGARLGISEVKVGLVAAGGGILRLPQRLPAGVALEMALTGEPITAEDAFRHGFVSRLTEPGGALHAGLDLAQLVAKNAPLAVATTKQLMRASRGLTDDEYFELQKPLVNAIFASEDAREGPRAFAQKREPIWTGS